ncbi:neither inactivation nor afterpotential protein G-like [Culicoides brevitarsis]|uniref:neither inactivation nor afterpotential protein G-like n=1 Tax=Culicoides brevitarsis TaxID=469753 RepID=UPI00307CBFB5
MRLLNIVIFLFTSCITLFFLFLILLWMYLDYEKIPNVVVKARREYDFIIVGSGTAGSTLAYALTREKNFSVLLIEAGDKFNVLSKIPMASITLQGNDRSDWGFKTVPQEFSSHGLIGNQQKWPRGKGLGGSAQINYMLHFGGVPKDFDDLEKFGGPEWSYDALKEHLSMPLENEGKCEKNDAKETCDDTRRLKNPYLKSFFEDISITQVNPLESVLTKAYLEAAEEVNEPVRFKAAQYYTKNGYRHSTYHTYLKPAFFHENLHIMTKTQVLKVLFDEKSAVGVLVARDYETPFEIKARKEVILCAGAVQTPQILKISGVGPLDELKNFQIPPIAENSFVGRNLYDHFNMPLFVSVNTSSTVNLKKMLSISAMMEYIKNGTGIYSNMAIFAQGSSLQGDHANLVFAMGSADEKALKDVSNYKVETFRKFFPRYFNHSEEGFVIISTCHKPTSRGTVKLSGNSVLDEPLIDPRYLETEADVRCMLDAVRLSFEVVRSKPLQKLGAIIHWPLMKECVENEDLEQEKLPSERYLVCLMRQGALTAHHPGGTCALGTSDSAVDEHLRVRGVKKLRVVDASVIPMPVSGTPNYIISVVAKKAAKIILKNV